MTALELKAIRALPADWIVDGLRLMTLRRENRSEFVVAMHPLKAPMKYEGGAWTVLLPLHSEDKNTEEVI